VIGYSLIWEFNTSSTVISFLSKLKLDGYEYFNFFEVVLKKLLMFDCE